MKVTFKARKTKNGWSFWLVHSDGTYLASDGKRRANVEVYRARLQGRPEDWQPKNKRLNRKSPRFRHLSREMERIKAEIWGIIDSMRAQGIQPSPSRVREAWEGGKHKLSLFALFAVYVEEREDLSPQSLRLYKFAGAKLKSFLGGRASFADLSPNTGKAWADWMKAQGISPATVATYTAKIVKFLKDTQAKGLHNNKSFEAWEVKQVKTKRPAFNREEREALEAYQPETEKEEKAKDLALFLLDMNFRWSELCGLSPEYEREGIIYYKKGKRKREEQSLGKKRLSPRAAKVLKKYGGKLPVEAFCNVDARRLSPATFNKVVKEICRKAGIDRPVMDRAGEVRPLWELVSSHTFRHSFARRAWRELGADPARISLAMGQDSPQSIKPYLDPGEEDAFDLFDKI
jgi:integrase